MRPASALVGASEAGHISKKAHGGAQAISGEQFAGIN